MPRSIYRSHIHTVPFSELTLTLLYPFRHILHAPFFNLNIALFAVAIPPFLVETNILLCLSFIGNLTISLPLRSSSSSRSASDFAFCDWRASAAVGSNYLAIDAGWVPYVSLINYQAYIYHMFIYALSLTHCVVIQ